MARGMLLVCSGVRVPAWEAPLGAVAFVGPCRLGMRLLAESFLVGQTGATQAALPSVGPTWSNLDLGGLCRPSRLFVVVLFPPLCDPAPCLMRGLLKGLAKGETMARLVRMLGGPKTPFVILCAYS